MKENTFEEAETFETLRSRLLEAVRQDGPVGPGVAAAAEALRENMERELRVEIKAIEGEVSSAKEEVEVARRMVKEKLLQVELEILEGLEQTKIYHEAGYPEDAEESWRYAALQCQQELDALDESRKEWKTIERNLAMAKAIASNYGSEIPKEVKDKMKQAENLLQQGWIKEERYARLANLCDEVWRVGREMGLAGA